MICVGEKNASICSCAFNIHTVAKHYKRLKFTLLQQLAWDLVTVTPKATSSLMPQHGVVLAL